MRQTTPKPTTTTRRTTTPKTTKLPQWFNRHMKKKEKQKSKTTPKPTTTRRPVTVKPVIQSPKTTKTAPTCSDNPEYAQYCQGLSRNSIKNRRLDLQAWIQNTFSAPDVDCSITLIANVCKMTCGICNGSKSVQFRTTQPPTTRKQELPKRTKCTRDEIGSLGCDQECLIVDDKPQAGFQNYALISAFYWLPGALC